MPFSVKQWFSNLYISNSAGVTTCSVVLFVCLFFFLAAQCSLWDLSSPTRDQTQALAVKARSPNHWTAREFPGTTCFEGISPGPDTENFGFVYLSGVQEILIQVTCRPHSRQPRDPDNSVEIPK